MRSLERSFIALFGVITIGIFRALEILTSCVVCIFWCVGGLVGDFQRFSM